MRRIALSLPGVSEEQGRFAFNVEHRGKPKGIVWVWLERVHPKKARVPNPEVVGVRVRDQADKAALLAGDPEVFFTEPHYDGYPAVLVRLRAVSRAQLVALIAEAWRCVAPKALVPKPAPARAVIATAPSARPARAPSPGARPRPRRTRPRPAPRPRRR